MSGLLRDAGAELRPDASRVVARLFLPGEGYARTGSRASDIMDRIEATPARPVSELAWDDAAKSTLDHLVEAQPILVRISAAKRLRDAAERLARVEGQPRVNEEHLGRSARLMTEGRMA